MFLLVSNTFSFKDHFFGALYSLNQPKAVSGPVSGPVSPSPEATSSASLIPTPTITPTPTPIVTPSPTPIVNRYKGEYFNNTTLNGAPVFVRSDNEINFNWANGSPGSGISSDKFSVRWTKTQLFEGGNYRFTVKSDDGMRIWIDNNRVYNRWNDQAAITRTFDVNISSGMHNIKIEYYENRLRAEALVNFVKK